MPNFNLQTFLRGGRAVSFPAASFRTPLVYRLLRSLQWFWTQDCLFFNVVSTYISHFYFLPFFSPPFPEVEVLLHLPEPHLPLFVSFPIHVVPVYIKIREFKNMLLKHFKQLFTNEPSTHQVCTIFPDVLSPISLLFSLRFHLFCHLRSPSISFQSFQP